MELTRLAANAAPFLLDVSIRSLILFAATGLACLLMRRVSAAARHLLWSATLVSLLLLPMLCACLPRWNAPVLPAAVRPPLGVVPAGNRTGSDHSQTTTQVPMGTNRYAASEPRRSPPSADDSPINSDDTGSGASVPRLATNTTDSAPGTPMPVAPPLPQARGAHAAAAPRPTNAEWLGVVWLLGFLAVLSRILLGILGAMRLTRRSSPVASAAVAEATEEARWKLGLRKPPSVREGGPTAPVAVPMTFGVLRPVVLLPEGAGGWPAERLRVVMTHELAHVGRRDWTTATLSRFVCALYWFHPLVWLAAHHLRVEGEQACDDLVLNSGVRAVEYADHLMKVVRGLVGRRVPPAVVTMAYRHEVTGRVRTILAECRNRSAVGRRGLSLAASATAVLLVPLAVIRPVSSTPSGTPNPGVGQDGAPIKVWAMKPHGAMMAGHSKWDVALPNGIRVRLLAAVVSLPNGNVECAWTPDGVTTVPLDTQLVRTYGPGPCQFQCGIVFPSARLQNGATVSGGEAGGTQGWTEGVPPWHNGQAVSVSIWPNSPSAWAGDWAGQGHGALQLTVASGPKVTLIAEAPTGGAARRLPTGELLTLSRPVVHEWPALHHQVATTEVTASVPSRFVRHLTDYSFEVIGQDGRPIRVQHAGTSEPDTSKKMTRISFDFRTSEAPLDRVKEIRLMYRPSQTALFRNVALRPIKSSVQVPLPSSPALLPLTLTEAQKEQVASDANLRLIGRALTQYAANHDEHLPDAERWMQQIIPFLVPATLTGAARHQHIAALFHDPASPPDQTWSYAYNRALSGLSLSKIDAPSQTVAVFESRQSVWNNSDNGQSIPQPGRHSGGNDYLFVDGHTKWLRTQSALPRFAPWDPSAHREIPIQGRIYDRRTRKPLCHTFVVFSKSPEKVTSGSVWPSSFTSKAGRFMSFVYPGRNYLMVLVNNRFTVISRTPNFEADRNNGRLTTLETRIGPPGSPASSYTIHLSLPRAYVLRMSSAPSTDHEMETMSFVPIARSLPH